MGNVSRLYAIVSIAAIALLAATGCAGRSQNPNEVRLILAAYTTPREAFAEIIPLFQDYWLDQTGQTVVFEESYQGSGAQSRAVAEGFEADIVVLALEVDVLRLEEAGLVTHDWRSAGGNGMMSNSVVAFAVRAGNPLGITDWPDLAEPGLEVLTPNPATSGGAMWNVLALYGAALRGQVNGVPAEDEQSAREFLSAVLSNVTVMDDSARDSLISFEQGIGDVAITYENEVLVGQRAGLDYDLVIPASTILIENPVAVVDEYVDDHGTRAVAEAFVEFLFSPEVREILALYGLRPVTPDVAAGSADRFPAVEDLFTIEFFGGWPRAREEIFGEQGVFNFALQDVQGQ